MPAARGSLLASVAAVLVLSACGLEDPTARSPSPRHEELAGPPRSPKEVLRSVAPSIAFVTTPTGTGSGVLLADGHVVTNAHVVDPFGTVDVTFEGGAGGAEDVPVVGVDLDRDLAVLGPLDRSCRRRAVRGLTAAEGRRALPRRVPRRGRRGRR